MPSKFEGGALVTRHNGQEIVHDWASSSAQKVQWAAFYSDVEHEILQVTEGHRVTLAYNLYYHNEMSKPSLELDVTISPFFINLKAALAHPHFLRCGGTLGFACQHSYVFDELRKLSECLPFLLKGSDRTIVLAAKSLDLKTQVRPAFDTHHTYENGFRDVGRDLPSDNEAVCVAECFREFTSEWFKGNFKQERTRNVIWCQDIVWKPALTAATYGNDRLVNILYQAAAILITIPPWEEGRQYRLSSKHDPAFRVDRDSRDSSDEKKKRRSCGHFHTVYSCSTCYDTANIETIMSRNYEEV